MSRSLSSHSLASRTRLRVSCAGSVWRLVGELRHWRVGLGLQSGPIAWPRPPPPPPLLPGGGCHVGTCELPRANYNLLNGERAVVHLTRGATLKLSILIQNIAQSGDDHTRLTGCWIG